MRLFLHILAGALALVSGYVALYSAKGATLHKRSGMVFVYTMLGMATLGASIAIFNDKAPAVNVPAALLTSYLVITGLRTVRPIAPDARWLDVTLMLVAFGVGVSTLALGVQAVQLGGKRNGIPAFPFFMFSTVGLLGAGLDFRVLRTAPLRGAARLARHLWRMCFALFIAALSFFLGQADVIPKPIRIPALLALPIVAVLATLLYWMWRVRLRKTVRGLIVSGSPLKSM